MDINQLLEKFYDGVSTPEEETVLKDFFLHNKVDDSWKADQQLFKALYSEEMQASTDVSERLMQTIDQLERPIQSIKRYSWLYRIAGAAAVVLLCVGLFYLTPRPEQTQMADTYDDPVEAAMAAEEVLVFMSLHLNKGLNQVADAGQKIEKANQVLNKHLKAE